MTTHRVFSPEDSGDLTRRRARRRLAVWQRCATATALIAGLGVLGAGWVGVRGVQTRDHLQHVGVLILRLRSQVEVGDTSAAAVTLAALQSETRAARAETGDPAWRIGHRIPVVGDDLAAVRTVAVAVDDLAHDGLPLLVQAAGTLDIQALVPTKGRINLAPMQAAAPRIEAADTAVRRARDRIGAIPIDSLTAQVRKAVVKLRNDLDHAAAKTATAARAAALLPAMLGANGPRTYLVLFQNLAEVRATGGMPGAYVVISAADGAVKIVDQGTASGLRRFDQPVLSLDPAIRSLYTDRIAVFPADVNFTPHFPTAAALAREMYRRRSGRTVDGVLATDPVALSYLLASLGPVSVPGGPALTGENAVRVLLSETYTRSQTPAQEDKYFSSAARATFEAIMRSTLDPARLMAQLAKAAGERRILLWSADPDQERAITGTVLAGALPASDGNRPTIGVFLNDGSGSKLGYYLTKSSELAVSDECRADGRRELTVRVKLGSTAPASGLAPSVLGEGMSGDPYTLRTNVVVYSPTGGTLVDMRLDGTPEPFGAGADGRRSVGIVTVDLKPGTSRTLDVTLLTGVPAAGWGRTVTPTLWTTPGVGPWPQSIRSADGCLPTR